MLRRTLISLNWFRSLFVCGSMKAVWHLALFSEIARNASSMYLAINSRYLHWEFPLLCNYKKFKNKQKECEKNLNN